MGSTAICMLIVMQHPWRKLSEGLWLIPQLLPSLAHAATYLASTDGRVPSADAQAEALQKVYSEIASPCCAHSGEEPATPRSSNDGNASPASEPERVAWS
jgi:hypothetical protein